MARTPDEEAEIREKLAASKRAADELAAKLPNDPDAKAIQALADNLVNPLEPPSYHNQPEGSVGGRGKILPASLLPGGATRRGVRGRNQGMAA